MAIKLDYVARETATNLTRNITLTLASILTVVVSLTLFGSAWMLNQGVNNANDRFKGGIEFIVYMQPASDDAQKDSIERDLLANPDVQSPEVVQALGDQFNEKPGVYDVVFAFEVVKRIQETFNKIGARFLIASGLLLLAALMLILNTIRVAMFARRREIEVMKLVGATNWFIRVPFIVEGIIQTLIGAAVAVISMSFVIRPFI